MFIHNLLTILQDTVVVDTIVQADTIGDLVSDVTLFLGTWVEYVVLAALGLVTKLLVDGEKIVLDGVGRLPAPVKAVLAAATAQVIMFVNAYLIGWGGPALTDDPALLVTGLAGIVVWFISMGWHGFLKTLLGGKDEEPTV
jgi:hypothetical protein